MHKQDEFLRDLLAETVQHTVNKVVQRHWPRPTQEHQLTSKIAHSMESLSGLRVLGHSMDVIVQDMPDHGRNTLEKRTGADLYIAIKMTGPFSNFQKGLLVQSKWAGSMTVPEASRLLGQCEKLVRRTKVGSFVWLYDADGAKVVPATEVLVNPTENPDALSTITINQHFKNIFDCISGDRDLVTDGVFQSPQILGGFLNDLDANTGVSISLNPTYE